MDARLFLGSPFLTEVEAAEFSQPAQKLPAHQKPSRMRNLPSALQPKAGDIKQIYACSLSCSVDKWFLTLLWLILDHVLLCPPLPPLNKPKILLHE